MATLSRVKKYEELRKSIEMEQINQNSNQEENEEVVSDPKQLLKAFDSSVFKKSQVNDEEVKAKRAKEIVDDEGEVHHDDEDRFTNEYLDDFMKEVREYNIKKGNREYDDTEVDILYQLSPSNSKKRAKYVQEIKSEENEEEANAEINTEEKADESDVIASKVMGLLDDSEEDSEEKRELDDELANYEDSITIIQDELRKEVEETIEQVKMQNQDNHEKLLDETLKMKKQLDSYESELDDLSKGVVKTNKLLNFIFVFLILVLLALIGYIVYTIWVSGVLPL